MLEPLLEVEVRIGHHACATDTVPPGNDAHADGNEDELDAGDRLRAVSFDNQVGVSRSIPVPVDESV